MKKIKNIVLVHGAFADGSGWQALYQILAEKGYNVVIVQNPNTSMADDVATTERELARLDGPAVLVGHSYGGAIITQAGVNDKVAALVYVAAFQPDTGESALDLIMTAPDLSGGAVLPPDANGFIYFSTEKFHSAFCADIPAQQAAFMAASQIPVHVNSFAAKMTQAAWHHKPTWAIVAGEDKAINPIIERRVYERSKSKTTEIAGASHVVFMSHPKEVAAVIDAAAVGATVGEAVVA
jgi:pimeloyl-ACP methyl ester carboxylesterase